MRLQLQKELAGTILDLGGGGEGVIGRLYQSQVTAIDNRQEELDEAPRGFAKLCMDATELSFGNASFDHATAFYFFMYLPANAHFTALQEAYRVLKKGGTLHIWDAEIEKADPFLTDLEIDVGGQMITTTYGVYKNNAKQDAAHFIELCAQIGFQLAEKQEADGHFSLRFLK